MGLAPWEGQNPISVEDWMGAGGGGSNSAPVVQKLCPLIKSAFIGTLIDVRKGKKTQWKFNRNLPNGGERGGWRGLSRIVGAAKKLRLGEGVARQANANKFHYSTSAFFEEIQGLVQK